VNGSGVVETVQALQKRVVPQFMLPPRAEGWTGAKAMRHHYRYHWDFNSIRRNPGCVVVVVH
jgi:hypothetical protein